MHQLNVLVLGPKSFFITLNELKFNLKFNISYGLNNLDNINIKNFDIILFHKKSIEDIKKKDKIFAENTNLIKILASNKTAKDIIYHEFLKLPTTINEINLIIENIIAKKNFYKNSSIKIKNYLLDKNQKKLIKGNNHILLTEKEIQLLEIFLKFKKSISRKQILSLVWNYSSGADTHTVETHIYRLRKKIYDKFSDDQFILNNKEGYYFEEKK